MPDSSDHSPLMTAHTVRTHTGPQWRTGIAGGFQPLTSLTTITTAAMAAMIRPMRMGPAPRPSKWIRNATISTNTKPRCHTQMPRPTVIATQTAMSTPHLVKTASSSSGSVRTAANAQATPAHGGVRRGDDVGRSMVCNRVPA